MLTIFFQKKKKNVLSMIRKIKIYAEKTLLVPIALKKESSLVLHFDGTLIGLELNIYMYS